jgi:DNA-binding response OmpR family regulator
MTGSGKLCALVVDDEFANRDFFVRLLQQANLDVYGASSGLKAKKILNEHGSDIVLVMLDQRLPDTSGMELLKEIRGQIPHAKIMMATMHDERSMIREAFREGCNGFMVKPHGFMELFKRIQNVSNDCRVLDELDQLIFDRHGVRNFKP